MLKKIYHELVAVRKELQAIRSALNPKSEMVAKEKAAGVSVPVTATQERRPRIEINPDDPQHRTKDYKGTMENDAGNIISYLLEKEITLDEAIKILQTADGKMRRARMVLAARAGKVSLKEALKET